MKIWLDDVRPAPDGYVWCKSVNKAKSTIAKMENENRKIKEESWGLKFDLLENILAVLEENNIEIPYNKLDVQIVKSETEV